MTALSNRAGWTLILGPPGTGKCVSAATLVSSPVWGARPICDFLPSDLKPDRFYPRRTRVDTSWGESRTSHVFNGGVTETRRIRTRAGFELEGTPEHPILVVRTDGHVEWRPLRDVDPGDVAILVRGAPGGTASRGLPPPPEPNGTRESIHAIPSHMSEELARLLGYLTAEGSTDGSEWALSNHDYRVLDSCARICWELFDYDPSRRHDARADGRCVGLSLSSTYLARWFHECGLHGTSWTKRIPSVVMTGSRSERRAFLRALFEGDGSVHGSRHTVEYGTRSPGLARDVHYLLLAHGVVASFREVTIDGAPFYRMQIAGEDYDRFRAYVGFDFKECPPRNVVSNTNKHLLLNVAPLIRAVKDASMPLPRAVHKLIGRYATGERAPSRTMLKRILAVTKDCEAAQQLRMLADEKFFHDRVVSVDSGRAQVVDFTVPNGHEFLSNGFISHNTTRCMSVLDDELARVEAREIALVTFTKAGANEARSRALKQLPITEDDVPWFRTIHSMAFRLLGMKREEVIGAKDLHEFCKRYGYEVSITFANEEDGPEFSGRGQHDWLFAAHSYNRNLLADADSPPKLTVSQHLDGSQEREATYREFAKRYKDFKAEVEKYDFHDMLERCIADGLRPPVRVAIIDEAQDLSPIQIRLAEQWFGSCERVYVAGDDDQTIFAWAGADPTWVVGLHKRVERTIILDRSYRVPQLVHAVALRVITQNENRVPKHYRSRRDRGDIHVADTLEAVLFLRKEQRRAFVLARNWYLLEEFADDLAHHGIPFIAEHHPHWSPLGRPTVVQAVNTAQRLQEGKPVSRAALERMLVFVPSITGPKGAKIRYLPHGFKKKLSQWSSNHIDAKMLREWGMTTVLDGIAAEGPTAVLLRKVSESRRLALKRLLDEHGSLPEPRVTLTSIHRSKGRERPVVVVLSDLAKSTWEEYAASDGEDENRVAYVAVTRAKETLVVCRPVTERSYPYQKYVRMVLEDPPPPIEPPAISVDQAKLILRGAERYTSDVEAYVLREWYDTVANACMYPELRQVGARYVALHEDLEREGLEPEDARWAAYLHCCGQSE